MTKESRCQYRTGGNIACPVCFRFITNHLPWELNSCYEKKPEWFDKEFNLK